MGSYRYRPRLHRDHAKIIGTFIEEWGQKEKFDARKFITVN
jgi:hypothetical protein